MSENKIVEELHKSMKQTRKIEKSVADPWAAGEARTRLTALNDMYSFFTGKKDSINSNSFDSLRPAEEIYEALLDYREALENTIEATREDAYTNVKLLNGLITQERRAELLLLDEFCTVLIEFVERQREMIS